MSAGSSTHLRAYRAQLRRPSLPSEVAMDDYPHFAATLHNTGSRDDLAQQVRALLGQL